MDDHTPAIYAALHKYAYPAERRDADFKQDVMVIVLDKFNQKYDPKKSKVTTYLYCLTWSAVQQVRYLRKLKSERMPTVFLGDTDVVAPRIIPAIDNKDGLEDALQLLLPRYKQAVTLVFYNSCTYEEARKIMGVTRQRVEQLTKKGILAMRVILTAKQKRLERKKHANDV